MQPLQTRRQWIAHSLQLGLAATAAGPIFSSRSRLRADEAEQASNELGIDARIRRDAQAAPLRLQFQGKTRAEFDAWHQEFECVLRRCLGDPQPPSEWKTTVEDRTELADHTRASLLLEAEGHPPLPLYLLLPKDMKPGEKRPGVLAIHGHGNHGHHPVAGRDDLPGVATAIRSSNYDYGRQLARQGYVVVCPCLTPFGRRLGTNYENYRQDACGVTFIRLQLLGKILMAENLRDCLWAIEHLCRQPQVDAERLACVGLSYGGRMTMLTAALEPRIKIAVPSGALNVMQERVQVRYSCGAQVVPGLLQYGDVPEIASLIAPRICLWETGSNDGLIQADWAAQAWDRMQRAWQAAGKIDHLQIDRFEGGHRWHGDVAYEQLRLAFAGKQ